MKLNRKGFTMIEMLAAVTIMAILAGVAVAAVTRYQEKARQQTYEAMETSAFNAAQNYIQDKGIIIPTSGEKTIRIDTLVDSGYLQKLEDPRSKGYYCHNGSFVYVKRQAASNDVLEKYTYRVVIKCEHYTSKHFEGNTEVAGVIFES